MNNQRPLSNRKVVQVMVALTLLAWATQTLFHQWGFGQEVHFVASAGSDAPADAQPASDAQPERDAQPASETFVPQTATPGNRAHGTLILRTDAIVPGAQIKLRNICRWSDADASVFATVADLPVGRVAADRVYTSITNADIRNVLHDAGLNAALINISGATRCLVSRMDVHDDTQAAMQSWIDAHNAPAPDAQPAPAPAPVVAQPVQDLHRAGDGPALPATTVADAKPLHTLRQALIDDLCTRLQLDPDAVQITFDATSEGVLNLVEPYFHFTLSPQRVRNLGDVVWDVTITADTSSQKVRIMGSARAWQGQVVLVKPLAYRQVIRDEDVVDKRVLIDALPDDPVLTRGQAVGQQASRDLKPGTLLTARLVDPTLLARPGQLITVTVNRGTVRITTVAKAMEGGSFGQTIRAKTDSEPPQTFDVTLTGPQSGTLDAPKATQVADAVNP